MRIPPACFAVITALWVFPMPASGLDLLKDGFERSSRLVLSKTAQGRARVSTDFSPATGRRHLVLDDSKRDAVYSSAEATATIDLSRKRNVVLQFSAKSLGNEADPPPGGVFTNFRNYDGVAVSADGGKTWKAVQSLSAVGTSWTGFSLALDPVIASLDGFGPGFKIRFCGYDNAPAGIDGLAIDDVLVTADQDLRLIMELPEGLEEGSGPHTGYVLLDSAPSRPLVLELSSSLPGVLKLPPSVTVPAGKTFVSFEFSAEEDSLVTLTRSVVVNATAPLFESKPASVAVHDNDAPVPSLRLPTQVAEGATPSNNGFLSLDKAASVPLTFSLVADPAGELSIPSTLTIPAGSIQVAFNVRAVNDSRIDGDIPVTVTASVPGAAMASGVVLASDNETRAITLSVPSTIAEGGAGSGSVTISGTLTYAMVVSLSGSGGSGLEFPAALEIPAGQTQASFSVVAAENSLKDGTRSINLAAAAPFFPTATKTVVIRDNDVAAYQFSTLADVLNISSPVSVTVTARDIEGNALVPAGAVSLSLDYPDGTNAPLTPGSITITSANGWTGNVTLPAATTSPLRLRASDAQGSSGSSNPFEILRSLNLVTSDLLWDAGRGAIYASVPAAATGSIHANKVVAIDPATLQVIRSVSTGQDPGQLAITSGGEYLYVALNGNGTVAKIDLATMSVASTFAVGTNPSYGTLFVSDMCTVAGQPDVVVISQYRKNVSPKHDGVAAYDNGVMRPVETQDHTGSDIIEPSADPTIFFGFNTGSSEFGFRTLKLGPTGMTQLEVKRDLFTGYSADMRSAGDMVYSTGGSVVDGPKLKRTGSFGTSGPVFPDGSANRVYFLEGQSSSPLKLAAFDPVTFALIGRQSLPSGLTSTGSLIRWGVNGLAFRSATAIHLISSSLVPSEPPADLSVSVEASPNPATAGAPLVYTLKVENAGPNPSKATALGVRLSDGQAYVGAVASTGTPVASGLTVNWPVGELAAGASATLTVTTRPDSAGSLTLSASALSNSIDTNFTNNNAAKLVSVGFNSTPDTVNTLRLAANNLVWDSSRKLLWATIPGTVEAPLGKSLVSIDPQNGLISDPLPIGATPFANSMAISANGRYLYVGLSDVPEVHRLDLSTTPPTSVRIALGTSQWGSANYAQDLEVLPGDGTSFMMAGSDDHGAAIYDGTVRRSTRTGIYSVDRIEAGPTPDVFIGYNNYTSGFGLSRITASAGGATISQQVSNVFTGYYLDFDAEGSLMLSSSGLVVDSNTLALKTNLGVSGRPCVDAANSRVYLVSGNGLRAYDPYTGTSAGILPLPVTTTGDWALLCRRWGADGMAILGKDDGKIHIARWSAVAPGPSTAMAAGSPGQPATLRTAAPGDADDDGDGIPNALEYLFGSRPDQADAGSPLKTELVSESGQRSFRITYPRREGVDRERYRFEYSDNLRLWSEAGSVRERVISSVLVDGIAVEKVEATIALPQSSVGFVRLVWIEN
jgi:YVTN family beta-propeller protein